MSFTLGGYWLLVMTLIALTTTVCTGLNILIGLSGQISFGHVAFYAIGAYISALMLMAGVPLGLAMATAAVAAAIVGALLAIPAVRVSGPYLAMVTIAFGFIVHHGLIEWRSVTGGSNGIAGVPMPDVGSLPADTGLALIAITLMIASLGFFNRLTTSGWGRAIRSVKATEIAARSLGFNPVQTKTLAFALSALFAGVAGSLLSPLMMFINPESFPFTQSILFVLAVIVGGAGTVLGPLLGGLLIVMVPELLSGMAEMRLLLFAAVLLGVLWIAPTGVLGIMHKRFVHPVMVAPGKKPDLQRLSTYLTCDAAAPEGLKVDSIGIRFGGVQAAENVSFNASPGSVTSVIGPNGAGKTTVLNMISGFYTPDTGRIDLNGNLAGLPAWKIARAGIGRTYQTTQLFAGLSVLENILAGMQQGKLGDCWRRPDKEMLALAKDLLALVGYQGSIHTPAEDLPHVDRRLVEIARALALRPRVLLLDEPAAGLSRADTDQVAELLRTIANYGIAVILVEHDMTMVMAVSDRILVLDSGQPIAWGEPEAVRSNPAVVRAYLGSTDYQAPPRPTPWNGSRDATLFVKDLVIDYGAAPVVEGVSLVVNPGELVAILGANGAGKSSILQAVAGLHAPSSGKVVLENHNIESLDASAIARKGLALVPEGRQVFAELSVRDNLLMGAYTRSESAVYEQDIEDILGRFPRLRDRIDSPAGLLSGGEQQMVAIGRGLMAKPSILLLDEPSLGLAPAMVAELYDALAALRDEGVTLLLVDQMANLALQVADRAYVLETGRIVHSGDAATLRNDPELEAAYLGANVA
ncbi:branched-chain amino acid ABC transporter ATP-binding protein/permease [Halomonas sp. LS-001]